jgi:hypothetical protein
MDLPEGVFVSGNGADGLGNPDYRMPNVEGGGDADSCSMVFCAILLYYFAFYVIEHYVDEEYKFSGLWSFIMYLCRGRKGKAE